MASHITQAPSGECRALSPFKYTISGSFAPNGSSAISADSNEGDVACFSVAYISTGLYRITLTYVANAIERVNASLQLASAAARWVQVGSISDTNRTVDIRVVDATGTVQDVAADANNRINFDIVVRGSSRKRF